MRRRIPWKWLGLALLISPVLLCVGLGLLPAPSDPLVPESEIVVGARELSAAEAEAFPTIEEPADNPSTPEKEQLGYLLFFDPVLSTNNDMSCATCHHPDLGWSDGRATSMGAEGNGIGPVREGGAAMARNAATLYEAGYRDALFWDGRVGALEEQAQMPLTLATEMHADLDETVAELAAIDEYQALFAAAFPDDPAPIHFENIARALAAFQRTLTAHNTPFDRYVAGDESALTPSQRRGWALFRSGATGCYRCHSAPLFTDGSFAALGVPNAAGALDDDLGRAEVTGAAADQHAFRTPTLRNVALTAPYMHNGVFATLEEVVDFYAVGGGAGLGLEVPNQSRWVRPFSLSEQERADLLNFLYALTDESDLPPIPDSLPSGLEPVPPLENPARAQVAAANTGGPERLSRAPTTLRVEPGQTIQSVVDQARDGDTIEIAPGTYHERVVADQDNLTIRGIPDQNGEWPTLDGQMEFADGISATGDNFLVEQLRIMNYNGNGVIVEGATGIVMRDLYIENTSLYGAYPVKSTDVLVERVVATGIRDAGVYVGQSRDAVIRNNEVYGNVIGIEIENSIGVQVHDNHAHDNSTGIFVDLLPQLPSKVSLDTQLFDNLVENNNHANFANEGEIGALVPSGTGILVLGGDDVEITDNVVRGNRTVGVAIFSTEIAFDTEQIDVGPSPERIHVHGNSYENNGYDPAAALRDQGIPGSDIVWDGSNWDVRFDESGASSFPPLLPGSRWPDVVRRGYWQTLNFLINNLL